MPAPDHLGRDWSLVPLGCQAQGQKIELSLVLTESHSVTEINSQSFKASQHMLLCSTHIIINYHLKWHSMAKNRCCQNKNKHIFSDDLNTT